MTVQLYQQALETISDKPDGGSAVRLDQQSVEVVNNALPTVQLGQMAIEVANVTPPPVQLFQFGFEVLSSVIEAVFDPAIAFMGLEPGGEITERWQWVTDVQTARSGEQIRASLRAEPRVQVEYDVATTTLPDSVLLDQLMTGWQSKFYYLPVWQDRARLGAAYGPAATTISTPLSGFGYVDGGLIGLWTSMTDYKVIQVLYADFDTDTLTLAEPLGKSLGETAWIAPIRKAWLSSEASAARFTGSSFEAKLVFNLEDPVPLERIEWRRDRGGAIEIDGFAIFDRIPNWTNAPQVTYSRRLDTIIDDTVKPWRYDPSGRGWIARAELHTLTSRADINELLSWVAFRRGRARSYLAPVWDATLDVTRSNLSGATSLYVASRNYQQMLSVIEGRNYVALRDATGWIVRKVVSAAPAEDNAAEDVLTLSSAIGRAGTPDGWLDVVWCEPAHLTSDTFEMRWWDGQTADVVISSQQVIA
jgi:hypothetical protein